MIMENLIVIAGRMLSSVMILDWWVDPEETTMFTQGAQMEAITVLLD